MAGTNVLGIFLFIIGICIGIFTTLILSKKNVRTSSKSTEESSEASQFITEIDSSNSISSIEEEAEKSSGELKLIGVDERTAALVIASVCDHLQTPLDELQFKSIKALD